MLKYFLLLGTISTSLLALGQRNCGTSNYAQGLLKAYPPMVGRYGASNSSANLKENLNKLSGKIKIPVIIHVVYNTKEQNLPDSIIKGQIDQLNLDFSAKNKDIKQTPGAFKDRIADCGFEFVLDRILRVKTPHKNFIINMYGNTIQDHPIKFSHLGGSSAISSKQYLNIWVGSISDIDAKNGQLLGYGTFPGGVDDFDGVVIFYKAFGKTMQQTSYNMGRTLTHEVGHWLNLIHIGGDRKGGCGDDAVSDTPPQKGGSSIEGTGNDSGQNFGCPKHPLKRKNECDGTNAEMFMNFMDYVDDHCMVMFTNGQRDRMRAEFTEGGNRAGFMSNNKYNSELAFAGGRRSDALAPVITEYKVHYLCKPVYDTCRYAYFSWTRIEEAKEYKVFAKQVDSEHWQEVTTTEAHIKIGNLVSRRLYEVKVQAVLNDGTTSTESVPYVFRLIGNNSLKQPKELKLFK